VTDRDDSQTPAQRLAEAVVAARINRATDIAAERLAAGARPLSLIRELVEVALGLSGRELQGATWSHAVLSTLAAGELAARLPDAVVAPAVVGLAGFMAFARPSRIATDQELVRQSPEELLRRAFDAPEGWGHGLLVAGHVLRAPWSDLSPSLSDAARRYLTRTEAGPSRDGDVVTTHPGGLDPDRAVALAEAVVQAGPSPLALEGTRPELAAGIGLAALELLRQAPDMRAIHHLTVLREVLVAEVQSSDRGFVLGGRFVADGWERARRDRRAIASPEFRITPGPAVDREVVTELLRVEPRPNLGHNIKLAAAGLALEELLPAGVHPQLGAAVAATLPTWTRGRRPWLALQAARRAL
jgi:hypothetical protein